MGTVKIGSPRKTSTTYMRNQTMLEIVRELGEILTPGHG